MREVPFCKKPCPSCPWRKGAKAADIPGFQSAYALGLERLWDAPLFFPIMACHGSQEGKDAACAGFLLAQRAASYPSVALRYLLAKGTIDMEQVANDDGTELYKDLVSMNDNLLNRRPTEE